VAGTTKRQRNREGRMSLREHLRELRKRLFLAALGLVAGTVAGWFLYYLVWDALRAPVDAIAEARNAVLTYPNVTSGFDLHFQIAFFVGVFVSSPVWLYQIFAFLVPGLTRREKGYTFGFFFTAVPLFLAGCAAGWFVLPHIVALMTSFVPQQDTAYLVAGDYFMFVFKLVIAVGVAFVLPVFLVLFNFMGIVSAKSILKSWRVAMLLIILFTAIATPAADVVSMFLLAIPMVLLYFAAAGVAALHDRRAARRQSALLAAELPT